MAILPLAAALQIAASCAPSVAPQTLLSVVYTESRLSEFAIGDNTTRQAYQPATLNEAVAIAERLIAAGHSVDLGIAQINSSAGHLQRRGLPVAAAFDPCTGFRVGGEVLAECYERTSGADEQARLRQAASCYNTGTLDRGVAYVQRVQASADFIVPAVRARGELAGSGRGLAPVSVQPLPPPPASWDVYGQARARRAPDAAPYNPNRTPPAATASAVELPVQLRVSTNAR